MDSPVGQLRLIAHGGALEAIEYEPFRGLPDGRPLGERSDDDPLLSRAVAQLGEYFARERREFDLPLRPRGTTFQVAVWDELRKVGWGQTCSYGDLAKRLGKTIAAARAVGLANGQNPIPIVVPCHRVVGSDGALTGYSGGMDRKRALLDLEQDALF